MFGEPDGRATVTDEEGTERSDCKCSTDLRRLPFPLSNVAPSILSMPPISLKPKATVIHMHEFNSNRKSTHSN